MTGRPISRIARPGRLATRQVAQVMLLTCTLAMLIFLGEMLFFTAHERTRLATLADGLLNLEERSAAAALWNLDDDLAAQVLSGLEGMREVQGARIVDVDGKVRVAFAHQSGQAGLAVALGRRLLRDGGVVERALSYTDSLGQTSHIGVLQITLNPAAAGGDFIAYAMATLVGNLLRSLLIALVLVWSVHRFLARPIIEISKAIADVDANRPLARPVPLPENHRDDELGRLVEGINGALHLIHYEQNRLRALATLDSLTGLPNRVLLAERLERALVRAQGREAQVAVLFLDLDGFKHVNDSLGHNVGDELLQEVAKRLLACAGELDTVGRLGGDEFLLVLEGVNSREEVERSSQRIIAAISPVFNLGGRAVHASTAIGIAMFPGDGDDFESLLRAADTAMYSAKALGTGRLRFFSHDMTERAQNRRAMEADLRRAIEYGQFELHYQPQMDVGGTTLKAAEALVRWRHHNRLVAPGEFIALAEETGLILPISTWVLDNACAAISRWNRRRRAVPLAINLSSLDFADPSLPRRVADALSRHQVPARLLELEITETSLMGNVEHCAVVLSQLREIGVRVAVDDFGTGYSSLAYLRRLPIDILKIDRTFINGLPDDPVIASMIIALGRKMGLVTVAEGVETEVQRAWLMREKCDLIQGWLIAPALPPAEFEQRFLPSDPQPAVLNQA